MVDTRVGNTICSIDRQKISGHVLIVVLLLSLIVSMIVMISLETSVLQTKITRNYQNEVLNFVSAEASLQRLENEILQEAWEFENSALKDNMAHAEKLQFVTDTLEFGERQGVVYYQLDVQQKDLNGAQTHLQSVVAIRSASLDTEPVIVQTVSSHTTEKNDIKATRLGYTQGDASPRVQRLWQRALPKPVSQAILVGQPDFPFPDHWPWTRSRPHPPENAMHAEKYSDFSQKQMSRSPLVYQIDGEYHLHVFELETGQSRIDFDLKSLFSTLVAEEEEESREVTLAPELMHADIFYDNKWHSVLVGIVGAKRQAVFCMELTSVLSGAVAQKQLNLLWTLDDPHGFFSLPTLSRMADNVWYLILAQAGCLDDNHLSAGFKMINFKTGVVSQDKGIPIKNKNATCKRPVQFSAMTAIDSKSRGYVDYLYAGDNLGRLWKFDVENPFLQSGGFIRHSLLFSMNDNSVYPCEIHKANNAEDSSVRSVSGEILSQPKIVLHPEQGFLISFLAKYSNDTQHYLINIWDKDEHLGKVPYLFSTLKLADYSSSVETENWYVPIGHVHTYPLVQNKQLFIISEGNQLIAKDMRSSKTCAQANYQRLFSQSASSSSFRFVGAPLIFSQGFKQPSLVLHGLSDGSFAWTELDLNDKIGRRTWRELNH